ncbi:TolC family protein, partial [Saccharophagus degradans]
LEECIQYAIDHNLEVKQQLFALEDAKLTTSNAKGSFLPNLNVSARNSWNNGLSQNVTTGVLINQTTRNSSYGVSSSI